MGIPLSPVGRVSIAAALWNVPLGATPATQESRDLDALMSVAVIVMLLRLAQPKNILE